MRSLIHQRLLNELLNKLGVSPYTSDTNITANHHSLAVLYIIQELSDIDAAIRIQLLSMLIANSIFKDTYNLSPIRYAVVTTESSHLRMMKLT